jgi:Tfp pilus assembly protein PilF
VSRFGSALRLDDARKRRSREVVPFTNDERGRSCMGSANADPRRRAARRHEPPPPATGPARPRLLLPLALVAAATFAAYAPAWHGEPVWDDDAHLTSPELRSVDGLRRIWLEPGSTQQYYPLAHSAFWVLHRLLGDDTLGYHLVTIGLHAISAALVALLLVRLAVPGALLAATLFALHPVQVESVAWMTEIKNTLSGVFYLSAAIAYLRFDRARHWRWYAAASVLFLFALLTKTVTATLPAALLIVFWWQRGRIEWRRDVMPLVPWLAIGLAAGLFTAWVEQALVGARSEDFPLTPIERALLAGRAVWFYLGSLAWPANLTFIYPRWQISQTDWLQYLPLAGLVALFALSYRLRRRSRAPLAAVLLFCGALFPALGFVNVYPFRYSFVADHFQYLATIPIFALAASALVTALERRGRAAWRMPVALAIGALLAVLTWNQSRQYADAETLYTETLRRNPAATMAHINLGLLYLQGPPDRREAAADHLEEATRLEPGNADAWVNLGAALQQSGSLDDAAAAYREALRLRPAHGAAQNNLGAVLEGLNRHAEAAEAYAEAIRLTPESAEIRANLGRALLALGRTEDAAAQFTEALALDESSASTRYLLATALAELGRLDEAVAEYSRALADPVLAATPEVHNDFGVALARLGRLPEAARHFEEALRIDPAFTAARKNLAATDQ